MTQVEAKPSSTRRVLCNVAGAVTVCTATLLAVVALCSLGVLRNGLVVWLVATVIFQGASLYIWHVDAKRGAWRSGEWLGAFLISLITGAVLFGVNVLTGSLRGHFNSFVEAASHGFQLVNAAIVATCPAATILFAGGWVRAAFRERLLPTGSLDD